MEYTYNLKTDDLIYEPNIADLLTDDQLQSIGNQIVLDFDADLQSRSVW